MHTGGQKTLGQGCLLALPTVSRWFCPCRPIAGRTNAAHSGTPCLFARSELVCAVYFQKPVSRPMHRDVHRLVATINPDNLSQCAAPSVEPSKQLDVPGEYWRPRSTPRAQELKTQKHADPSCVSRIAARP